MLSTGYSVAIHRLSTAWSCPQVIHTLFTGYPQAQGYPHLAHRISTELSTGRGYPQVAHTFSTELSTGSILVLHFRVCGKSMPYRIVQPFPYTSLTARHLVGSLFVRAASPSTPDLLSNTCIITPVPYRILTTLITVRVFLQCLTGAAECYTIQAYTLRSRDGDILLYQNSCL